MNLLTTNTNSLFQIHIQIPTTGFHYKPSLLKCPLSFHLTRLTSYSSFSKQTMPPNDDTFAEEEDDDEEEEEEDEDIFVPLSKMREWSRNKPLGFGEGKVYDTSLEDKLLEELQHATAAQLTNPIPISPKHKQAEVVVPNGIGVRLFNLPKKKNIHRDLQAAFKGFPGIINIVPAVSGNQKTRDPLCKGFAFVHFNSHHQANRFVDMVSTQPITFGKVQKQIRCEIMKQPSVERIETPLPVSNAPVTETPPLDPSVKDNDTSFRQLIEAQVTSEKQNMVAVTEKGKKATRAKKKLENTPKLNIPGSASRLKMKEKALLSGVFSKYGGKSSD